ncbi:MAG: carboxypeptidase regulatory-like domain-containing protein [Thermoanaerobaculia bacterium]
MRFAMSMLVGISLSLSACAGPRIEGVVRTCGGAPLPGVSVSVEGAEAVTTTDNAGRYRLDAPDGLRTLRYARTGFTTESLRVMLSSGQSLPASEVVLYPVPPEGPAGAVWAGAAGATPLPRASLESRRQGSASKLTEEWVVAPQPDLSALPEIPAGPATFVLRAASEPILLRLDEVDAPATALVVSRSVSAWGIERERQERAVAAKCVRAGGEGVLVVETDLAPGLYLLRETVQTAPFPAAPAPSGWLFRAAAPGGVKAEL